MAISLDFYSCRYMGPVFLQEENVTKLALFILDSSVSSKLWRKSAIFARIEQEARVGNRIPLAEFKGTHSTRFLIEEMKSNYNIA
jgi:hypothetical protein